MQHGRVTIYIAFRGRKRGCPSIRRPWIRPDHAQSTQGHQLADPLRWSQRSRQALTDWEHDDDSSRRRGRPAPATAACARAATSSRSITAPAPTGPRRDEFWYDEYVLNAQIGRFSKPYVALMDGIVMGGGVGVAAHGSVRVVTDTTKMAMPEVGIGLIPDVGGTFILSRAPGLLGLHAALTGAPFGAADAIAHGLRRPLRAARQPRRVRATRSSPTASTRPWPRTPPSRRRVELLAQREWIDECYRGRDRRRHRRGAARPRRGTGQRRGQPDRDALPDLGVRRAGGGAPRRQA